jgi:hypothetical protein
MTFSLPHTPSLFFYPVTCLLKTKTVSPTYGHFETTIVRWSIVFGATRVLFFRRGVVCARRGLVCGVW